MTDPVDPRVSDEATGLPPLEELGDDETLVVLAWSSGEGLVHNPLADVSVAVRFLHLRGLANNSDRPGVVAEWAQTHIAVPVEVALDVAADLARGAPADEPPPVDRCRAAVAEVRAAFAAINLGPIPGRDREDTLADIFRLHLEALERGVAIAAAREFGR